MSINYQNNYLVSPLLNYHNKICNTFSELPNSINEAGLEIGIRICQVVAIPFAYITLAFGALIGIVFDSWIQDRIIEPISSPSLPNSQIDKSANQGPDLGNQNVPQPENKGLPKQENKSYQPTPKQRNETRNLKNKDNIIRDPRLLVMLEQDKQKKFEQKFSEKLNKHLEPLSEECVNCFPESNKGGHSSIWIMKSYGFEMYLQDTFKNNPNVVVLPIAYENNPFERSTISFETLANSFKAWIQQDQGSRYLLIPIDSYHEDSGIVIDRETSTIINFLPQENSRPDFCNKIIDMISAEKQFTIQKNSQSHVTGMWSLSYRTLHFFLKTVEGTPEEGLNNPLSDQGLLTMMNQYRAFRVNASKVYSEPQPQFMKEIIELYQQNPWNLEITNRIIIELQRICLDDSQTPQSCKEFNAIFTFISQHSEIISRLCLIEYGTWLTYYSPIYQNFLKFTYNCADTDKTSIMSDCFLKILNEAQTILKG